MGSQLRVAHFTTVVINMTFSSIRTLVQLHDWQYSHVSSCRLHPLQPSPASALPPASLRLLVPPLRLLAAAMWQVVRQQSIKHLGMLEDFVFLVTEAVPQLLTERQRSLLLLALRAKVSQTRLLFVFSSSTNFNEIIKNVFIYPHNSGIAYVQCCIV